MRRGKGGRHARIGGEKNTEAKEGEGTNFSIERRGNKGTVGEGISQRNTETQEMQKRRHYLKGTQYYGAAP